MGLSSVFLGLGQFIGSSLGGPFIDWLGADGMVLSTALLGIIAGFLLLRMQAVERRFGIEKGMPIPAGKGASELPSPKGEG